MKSKWIDYFTKRILYIDLSHFGDDVKGFSDELSETITKTGQEMYQYPLHTALVLVDLTGTTMTRESNKLLSAVITDTRKYISRTAVVGMTGLRKVFLDYFGRLADSETASFEEVEAAKKWLVS
jgi:hypothetical protein